MCPQARYNWKLTSSISSFFSFFFNNYTSRTPRENGDTGALSRQCVSYLPVLAVSPILISRRAIWTLPQYMAKYFRYLPVGCEIDNPRPFNHARDFRGTKSFVPSSNLLLYITTQVYTGYIYNSRSANTAVNIGDMSSISRKTYCRPTTLESKWKAKPARRNM